MRLVTLKTKPTYSLLQRTARGVVLQMMMTPVYAIGTDILLLLLFLLNSGHKKTATDSPEPMAVLKNLIVSFLLNQNISAHGYGLLDRKPGNRAYLCMCELRIHGANHR